MTTPLVSVDRLSVAFTTPQGEIRAVNEVSYAVHKGETLCILGESGSGKSVSLRALLGLIPPRQARVTGSVRLDSFDILSMSQRELQKIRGSLASMIFQDPLAAFDPLYTIEQQIAEVVRRHEACSDQAAAARALELFERVGIPSPRTRLRSYPHELSGGLRQRAMIALALSCRPRILLADEPTTALDATIQIQILGLLRDLKEELGMSMIVVTHDLGVAAEIADRIAVMYAGRLVETGSVRQILRAPRHPYARGLLNSTITRQRHGAALLPIPGSPPDPAALPRGCSFSPRCAFALDECRRSEPPETFPDGRSVRCWRHEELL